ncbi:MAG TPA: HdeD family acid-resistance protein [Nitrospira sp.]|nr:HdeD family acid-resistance protein [Nitrospira sp.]
MDALSILCENWWAIALRGLLGILIGIVAFVLPLPTMLALVWLFGAYAILDGVFNLVTVWRKGRMRPWWAMALEGVLGLGVGIVSFIWPGITALALVYLIAAWALVTGVLEIIAAIRLRREIKGEWLLALSGVFSIALGVLFALVPDAGAVALVWFWGAYTAAFGILLIWLSFRLRAHYEDFKAQTAQAAA